MKAKILAVAAATVILGGCGASLPNVTGSLFSGSTQPVAAPVAQNDSVARAMQVGGTAARAQKCGFNFDANKLRMQFLAAEGATAPADVAKTTQIYDSAYRGVAKALSSRGEDYCSQAKSTVLKNALTRHMSGDYTPDGSGAGEGGETSAGLLQ